MNENLQFLQALKDVSDEDFNEDMNSISLTGEHEFSDKFNRKMKKLIARQKKQYFRFVSTAGRRAACIILAVVVISASALSVEAVRNAVYDFIIKIFSNHSVVTTESGTDDGYPTSIEEKYYISKLPAGFEQTQYGETDNSISVFYSNGKKKEFYLTRMSNVIIRYIWIMSERILRRSRSMVRNICFLNLILM